MAGQQEKGRKQRSFGGRSSSEEKTAEAKGIAARSSDYKDSCTRRKMIRLIFRYTNQAYWQEFHVLLPFITSFS